MRANEESEVGEAAFSGRITAAFTHEMKNVLAIIKESAGLMEDLLLMSREVPFPHKERFSRALTTIGEQINRGVDLSTRLNRFAHSLDEPSAVVDLNEMVEHFSMLVQRFARLKNVSLVIGPRKDEKDEEDMTLTTSPVRLQMALLAAVECCWNQIPAGSEVRLIPIRKEDGVAVGVFCRGDLNGRDHFVESISHSEGWGRLSRAMESLRGTVEWDIGEAGFFLTFPCG